MIGNNSFRWKTHVKQFKLEHSGWKNLLKHNSHIALEADMKTFNILYQSMLKSKLGYSNEIHESTIKTNSKSQIPVFIEVLRVCHRRLLKLSCRQDRNIYLEFINSIYSSSLNDKINQENEKKMKWLQSMIL